MQINTNVGFGSKTALVDDGFTIAALMLTKYAPALMQSIIVVASSSGIAMGRCPLTGVVSAKIGRISKVQSGQIAGDGEFLFVDKTPAQVSHVYRRGCG